MITNYLFFNSRDELLRIDVSKIFCVVMFGLINVNILYYSFSTLYQMCNLRQSL